MQNCSCTLTVDLNVVRSNLHVLSRFCPAIMPMVKANAYGTDAIQLARFLQDSSVPIIGVSHVDEGIILREAGITMPIFVISTPPFEAEKVVKYGLEAAVSSFEEVKALGVAAAFTQRVIPLHVEVNTGLNRFGISCEKALELASLICSYPFLRLEGLLTHFASAEAHDFDPFTLAQINSFKSVFEKMEPKPKWIHAANSPALLRFLLPFCNLARVGLSLFGFGQDLQLAVSLKTHIVSIRDAQRNESIGYGCTYRIEHEKMRIAVLPVGYHDGLHRHYSGKGYVIIGGIKAPMVGRICMDFMMVDVTAIPEAHVGKEVILFDQTLSPSLVASWGQTDVRELLCCLGPRIKRVFSYDTSKTSNEIYEREARLSSLI